MRAWQSVMKGHAEATEERCLELANQVESARKKVSTPCLDDHAFSEEEIQDDGELAPVASRTVLRLSILRVCIDPTCSGQ